MEIGSINRMDVAAPANSVNPTTQDPAMLRQIVTAVQGLNKSEFMAPDRQLVFMLDPKTQKPVIQIVARDSGDVIDQIPPEAILAMQQQLAKAVAKGKA